MHQKIVDCFTFNGEYDILEIRLNVLGDCVDEFVIVEAPTTFSGKTKPLYYELQKDRYMRWHDKITYFVIDENYTEEEITLAEESPNTKGAAHWKREFLQKENIKKALTHLHDEDIVFIGDVDEIWKPEMRLGRFGLPIKLKLFVYTYFLNNFSSEQFWGTVVATYKDIKNNCLNHIRSTVHYKTNGYCGWHFTSMGGLEEVRRKLADSYTEESYWNTDIQEHLAERHGKADFLGRPFTYRIDERDWPQYLKDNKERYTHLCANS